MSSVMPQTNFSPLYLGKVKMPPEHPSVAFCLYLQTLQLYLILDTGTSLKQGFYWVICLHFYLQQHNEISLH